MIIFRAFLFCFLFLFLSCEPVKRDSDDGGSVSRKERKKDRRGNLEDKNSRNSELSRLKSQNRTIKADVDVRYRGGIYYEGYDGEDCRESEECREICEDQIPSKNRGRCYKSPSDLVEELEDGFLALLNISETDSVKISPGLMAGMLDISVDRVVDLVEDRMSEGDLKSFLAWVAVNEDIARAFLAEDRRSEILKKAFKELGDLQESVIREEETGLNVGLIQSEDTFFHLSALEGNEAAFQIAYKVLKSVCSSRNCKMNVFCAREEQSRRRSRVFGYKALGCRTSSQPGRRARRDSTCYIHGASSWGFLDDLIEEKYVRDPHFKGEKNQITVEECNKFCGDKDSGKCKTVL